ncbi:MAG: phosphatase PAP2 family protein [Chthoniobacteraceae bacterium]
MARARALCWAFGLLASTALVVLGFALDAPFLRWLAQRREAPWEGVAQFVTHAGDWPPLALAVVCGVLLARIFRARRAMTLLGVMFAATLLAGAVVQPVRLLTGRARPQSQKAEGWYGLRKDGKWIAGKHRYSSFPSAHTTVAAAFLTPLLVIGGARCLPVWLLALVVGWTRVYLGAHHPSDVMAGLILGTGCGWLVARSPGLRWWTWRLASAFCGFRRFRTGRERGARVLLRGAKSVLVAE